LTVPNGERQGYQHNVGWRRAVVEQKTLDQHSVCAEFGRLAKVVGMADTAPGQHDRDAPSRKIVWKLLDF